MRAPACCWPCWRRRRSSTTAATRFPICSRSEEHTSELQSQSNLVCRLLLEKKKIPACNKMSGRVILPLTEVAQGLHVPCFSVLEAIFAGLHTLRTADRLETVRQSAGGVLS